MRQTDGFQMPLESGMSGCAMTAAHFIVIGIAIAVLMVGFLLIGPGE